MAVSSEYMEFIADQLERLGPIKMRRMFGGMGLYIDDMMFGVIFGEELYFKVDDSNRADYEAEEMDPFTYEMSNGKTGSISYYQVPERLYDDADELIDWARKSVEVMRRVHAEKRAKAARVAERKKKAPPKKKDVKKLAKKSAKTE
jgi:DNA transformation protein